MSKDFLLSGYTITTDPDFMDDQNALTPQLKWKLEKFHNLALQGKKSNIPKLLEAIEQYPDNPQLKNYLSVLYTNIGNKQKAFETNHWIVAEHPDYLFGKLNLANEHYLKGEYEKMPEILGESMEIKALYPHRDTFHLIEVVSFFKCAVLYYIAIGNIEQAELRYDVMKEIAPDSPDTESALQNLFAARLELGQKRFEEDEKNRISVKTKQQEKKNITTAPKFDNPETEWLYTHGLYIGEKKLEKILSLPRESIISDLERVLQDSIDRYAYFSELVESEGWDEEKMNFVVHAFYLLGELKASESIESIINVLSQSGEYLEFYFGDFTTSGIWEPVYKILNHDLNSCKQFVMKPGIDTYAKTLFSDIAEQIVHHQPERKTEVLNWFKDIIHFLLNSKIEDNVIDSDMIGLLICNVIDIEGKDLLPGIELLFEKGVVSTGICGKLDEVKDSFERPDNYSKKKDILPIAKRYDEITTTWAGYTEDEEYNSPLEDFDEPVMLPIRTESKVGRNDPCPCGSGKKYKKCCLNQN